MSDPIDWRDAFLVFSALLKEPPEAAALALGSAAGSPTGSSVAHALASASRTARARAMASVVTRVVGELQAARLR